MFCNQWHKLGAGFVQFTDEWQMVKEFAIITVFEQVSGLFGAASWAENML